MKKVFLNFVKLCRVIMNCCMYNLLITIKEAPYCAMSKSSDDLRDCCSFLNDNVFVKQANTPDELPEHLLGTCRLNHLDASKSVLVNEMNTT